MKGWILYKLSHQEITPEKYEINRFINVAQNEGIELTIIKPEEIEIIVTKDDRKSIFVNSVPVSLPDFVIPRMGAGTTFFALSVLRHLERLGVPVINTPLGVETVKDKLYSLQILAEKNLPVPKTMLLRFPVSNMELIKKQIGFPIIVKALSGSQGKGVYLADSEEQFRTLTELVELTNPSFNIILQEFISDSYGRDLRVIVIGGRVIGCMGRHAANGGFKANFSQGGTVDTYPITPEIEWLALEATKALSLDIAGVDLLFDHDHFKICEVNSSPGFKGFESCIDIDIPKAIYDYIRLRTGQL